jgi:hypothetical protein
MGVGAGSVGKVCAGGNRAAILRFYGLIFKGFKLFFYIRIRGHYLCWKISVLRFLFCYIVFLFFLLPLAGQVFTQPVELFQGETRNIPGSSEIPTIFGHDETGYYALSYKYDYIIEHYDPDLAFTHEQEINLGEGWWRKRELLAVYHFHDKIYLFTAEHRIGKRLLFVETVDKSTLQQNQDDNLVMNIKNLRGYSTEFHFESSKLEQKLLVYSQLDVISRHISDLNCIMFGKDLEILWEHTERILFEDRPIGQDVVKVNEVGNAFILSVVREEKPAGLFYMQSSKYNLLAITDNGDNAHQYTIQFPRNYIHGIMIEPGLDHDLGVAGFYSPSTNTYAANGIFYLSLDNRQQQLSKPRFYEFEEWFLRDAMQRHSSREPKQLYYFTLNHMIRQKNGDFLLLAENRRNWTYDTYLNIMAASISPGGILKWKKLILKNQQHNALTSRNYASYCVLAPPRQEKVYVFFNDHPKNLQWPDEDRIHALNETGRMNLKVIGINQDGILSSTIIYKKTENDMQAPVPLHNYIKWNNEIVIPAVWWNEYSYFRIRVNE